jgi:hypothetical protein
MASVYRRVVTGRNGEGRSVVASDSRIAVAVLGMADFWKTTTAPASLAADGDAAAGPPRLEPPPGGTCFRFFEIPAQDPAADPGQTERAAADAFAAAGASHCRMDTRRHAMMHTTSTIDYVVLLRGEVALLLDEGEVALRPFDVVVQRGTNHYWINRGSDPALLMGVLVDAR